MTDSLFPDFKTAVNFDDWWKWYPRKVGKQAARRAYNKATIEISSLVLLDRTKAFARQWAGKDRTYCPHPSTWLNQHRWDDEDLAAAVPTQPPSEPQAAPHVGHADAHWWQIACKAFEAHDGPAYRAWIAPLVLQGKTAQDSYMLTAPNRYHARHVSDHYGDVLRRFLGAPVEVRA